MTFLITDIPRLLPELLLLALALLVLGSDVLERWSSDPQVQRERSRAAALLTLYGLGFALLVALVQSKYLFTIAEPLAGSNGLLVSLIGLGRNLQAGGPGGEPILGAFSTDNLTMVARLTFIGAAFLTTLLTLDDAPSANPGEFYALLLFATVGMNAMAASSELIIAYIALELSSIALYVLAGYVRNDHMSSEAGLKYYLFGALSSGILLYGMSLAYGFTASISRDASGPPAVHTLFSEIAKASASSSGDTRLLTLAMVFVIAGIGYKIAVVPFHSWSPDVYQGAPTPITAFISTASKTAGFILLYRVLVAAFPALAGTPSLAGFGGWTSLLAIIALATVLVGNLSALPQTNAKRLLAYSSISHAGFILLALVLWRTSSTSDQNFSAAAFLYYLISYTATNLGAFGALAVVRQALGGDDISDLNGLSRRNLSLTVMLTVLVLSLAGIPPLAGFWAKFFVFMAAYGAGALWLVVVVVVMTVVSLYYYLGLLKAMWMREPTSLDPLPLPRAANSTLIIATALVVLLGVLPNLIWGILNNAALIAGR